LVGRGDFRRDERRRGGRRVERCLRAHHVVVHRAYRGGRGVLVVSGRVVATGSERFAAPIERLCAGGGVGLTIEELVPGTQSTSRVAAHEARQSATEGA